MTKPRLIGLVACGGMSTRMGQDKCLLEYHGMAQYRYVSGLLSPLCDTVYLSRSAGQPSLPGPWPTLTDDAAFAGHGPLSGLLTAFAQFPDSAFLLAGCDYPLVTAGIFERLVAARGEDTLAVCFAQPVTLQPEPLLAIYEAAAAEVLLQDFRQGRDSLRRFLQNNRVTVLPPGDGAFLASVDTPEARAAALKPGGQK